MRSQAFMFLAMEPPDEMSGPAIVAAKVALLRAVRTITPDAHGSEYFLGQFGASEDGQQKGYLEDDTVPHGSRCPTFAACVLHVDNDRWRERNATSAAAYGLLRAYLHTTSLQHSLRPGCRTPHACRL